MHCMGYLGTRIIGPGLIEGVAVDRRLRGLLRAHIPGAIRVLVRALVGGWGGCLAGNQFGKRSGERGQIGCLLRAYACDDGEDDL